MVLPPNVTIITPDLQTESGVYEIGGDQIHVHPFTINANEQYRIPVQQLPGKQSLSIRAWVGDDILGNSLFYRFHPGFGGLAHLFYDINDETPIPPTYPFYNEFAGQTYEPTDIVIGVQPGTYYYHVHNLERHDNAYKIGFMSTTFPNTSSDPCAVFN